MNNRYNPLSVFLIIVTIVVVSAIVGAIALGIYNQEPEWHDLGKVQSVGQMPTYDDNDQRWVTLYNATILTQHHGAITLFSHFPSDTCTFCPSIDWTMKVGNTVGVIKTNGGNYGVTVLVQ